MIQFNEPANRIVKEIRPTEKQEDDRAAEAFPFPGGAGPVQLCLPGMGISPHDIGYHYRKSAGASSMGRLLVLGPAPDHFSDHMAPLRRLASGAHCRRLAGQKGGASHYCGFCRGPGLFPLGGLGFSQPAQGHVRVGHA